MKPLAATFLATVASVVACLRLAADPNTPLALEANTTYFVVSQEVNGGDRWYDDNTGMATTNGATVTAAVYATNNSTAYSLGTGTTTNSYVPVNFKCATGAWNLAKETRYLYDDMTVVQERDQNNVPTITYTRGLDLSGTFQGAGGIGGLLARTAYDTATPSHAYYHADGNGNITALINAQQAIVAKYLYDPYGNTLAKAGLLADANTLRFASKDWHNGSGLYYYGFRFYDPNLQRWPNRDPIGERGFKTLRGKRSSVVLGDPICYEFIHNDPLNHIDPVGLWQWGWPPWGNKNDKKCTDCEKQDNPAKDLFKNAADNLASALGGKGGAAVRLLLLASDTKKGCGDMKGAADTCGDFAHDPNQEGCLQCCHAIMNSFPGLGGFSYFECHAICSRF